MIHIILLGSPLDYTLFVAGFPAGAMFGSILFSRIKIKTSLLTGLLIAPVGGILSTIALSRSPSLDPVLTLLTGLFVVLANIGLESIFIKLIPDAVMGKVNSFAAIFLMGGSPGMGALFDFLSRIILIHYIMFGAGILAILISLPAVSILKGLLGKVEKVVEIYDEEPTKKRA